MKRLLKAYTSFTRTEKTGVIVLLSIIILLIAIKTTMHMWVHPQYDKVKEAQLIKSWEAFKAQSNSKPAYTTSTSTPYYPKEVKSHVENAVTPSKHERIHLFNFDPNTIDSSGLMKLGLKEKTASIFLHWRAKGKKFYHKEELKKVYTLTTEDYERIEPYIHINTDLLK